ncbi:MAG: hypothetical protein ACR2QA_18090 [Solirubrobacteraceae bacterium]
MLLLARLSFAVALHDDLGLEGAAALPPAREPAQVVELTGEPLATVGDPPGVLAPTFCGHPGEPRVGAGPRELLTRLLNLGPDAGEL